MTAMPYNFHFEIGTAIALLILLFVVLGKKKLSTRTLLLFTVQLLLLIGYNITGAVCGMMHTGMVEAHGITKTVWDVADVVFTFGTVLNYMAYLLAVANLCDFKKWYVYGASVPMLVCAVISVTMAVLGDFVWETVYTNNTLGTLYIVMGTISVLYIIGVSCVIIFSHSRLLVQDRVLIVLMNCMLLASYLIQAMHLVDFRIIGPVASFMLFVYYLGVQSPDFYIDNMTGVFNKNAFDSMLWENVCYNKKTNCLLVAINEYNSLMRIHEYGHLSNLRKQLAEMLEDISKKETVYRINSSTFVVMAQEAERIKRLHMLLTAYLPKRWEMEEEIITTQYCYYHLQYDGGEVDFEQMKEWIKYACSDHKRHHEPGVLIHLAYDIMSEAEKEREVLHQIEEAILDQSMEIHMQPVYSMEQKKITSLEVLSRMKDKEQKYINPEYFIHVAEKNHRILQLGELIFRRACAFASQNKIFDMGIEYMNVNISPIQCQDEHLTENFMQIAKEYEIPVERIHLEITESEFQDPKMVELTLERLRKSGMQVALDDFGTGCSTLLSILELPLDYVKIDKSLVWSYDAGENSFLDDLMPIIRAEGKKVIAEGIETEDHIEIFRRLKGDFLQGYYFSKPLPERDFVNFVREFNKVEVS